MCADWALFVCFVITELLMDTASGMLTAREMNEQEINLKLRLKAPVKSSTFISYPNIVSSQTSSFTNPLFNAYHALQPPQPPARPIPPLNIRLQPHAILTRHVAYDGPPTDNWGGIIRPVRSRVKPPLVIHQPVVNYHYMPSAHVPPTQLIPIQVPVHVPVTTQTPPTIGPIIVVSGFNTSYGLNYGYNSGKSPATSTTPKPLVDLAELLKELKAGVDEPSEKPKDCPCNDTNKEIDLLNDPFFKNERKDPYKIGRLNDDYDDGDDYEDDQDDYDDVDDEPSGRVAAIRSMWSGYLPRYLLENALKQSKAKEEAKSKTALKRPPNQKRIKKGMDEVLLKQFENGLNALHETIKAHDNDKEIEDTITAMHDSNEDSTDDHEEKESHLTHFVDFWGNKVLKYKNDLTDEEQIVQESAAEYSKDPHGWNPEYTKGLWSEDDSHLQRFSGYQNQPEETKKEYYKDLREGVAANYNKYVSDNGTWLAGHYNPAGVDMSHIFNESVANERPLDNPNEKYGTYEKVVDFLNGKIPENKTVDSTQGPVQSGSDVKNATAAVGDNSGETISVKDLLAVLAEKKKEREGNAARTHGSESKKGDIKEEPIKEKEGHEKEDENSDSGEGEEDYVLTENTNIPADMIANIGRPPDGVLCKSVSDVGVVENNSNNATQMSHVRGFLCVKDYDEQEDVDEGNDTEDNATDNNDYEEKQIEQSLEHSQEISAE